MTTIAVILAAIFLEGWVRVVVIAALILFEVFEISIWLRWRKRRSITGAETLVGESGEVILTCRPSGQVKVRGQLWSATCSEGAEAGERIIVTAVHGVKLEVGRLDRARPARHPQRQE